LARNTNIKLRRSATAAAIPTTSNLDLGELALNTNDGKLYMKTTEGSLDSVIQVGSATDTYFKIRKTVNQNFTVTVASKTTDHVYNGLGSSSGYIINGIESPHLNFVPGNSYQFDQSDGSNSGHPLRFYYDAAKTTAYTAGVTTNGTAGSSGAYTKIVPTKDTPMVLYYQCTAHGYMGGSVSFATRNLTGFDTDELGEGSSNLYFTNARARGAISVTDSGGDGSLAYNSSTGVITYTGPSASEVRAHFSAGTGIGISGGTISTSITQYTDALARAAISVTDSGGDGSLAYNNSTGVITYTGPSAAEVRAHLSAGTGVTYSGGQISIGQAVATTSNVQFNNVQVDGTLTSDDITSTNIAATGNLTVSGNLTVNGTTTTLNTATLDVEDKNITLNKGSGDTSGSANGAGITIQDAVNSSTDATILWNTTSDAFDFSHPLTITSTTTNDTLLLTTTEASSSAAPVLTFKRNSGSPADADYLGQLKFKGENDADQEVVYAKVTAKIQDASDGSEDGLLEFANRKAGSNVITARLRSDSLQLLNGTSLVVAGLTYPTSDGTSGQALVTDGSGNLSFSTISSGGGTVTEAFKNIAVSGQTNIVADAATDTLTFAAGSGIQLTTTPGTDTLTITSTATGSVTEAFKTIAVSGQTNIVADSATDTLTLAAGSNMTITQDASTDTITFASSGSGGSSQSALYKEYVYTPGSSTTTFTGSDANGSTLSYTVGYISVYLNGVLLKPTTDYTATNGTSVVLVNTAVSGDVIQIATFVQIVGSGDSAITAVTYSGSGTITLSANPNHENNTQLYIDGVYQNKDTYSVSGTTLTFSTTPPAGALVEVVIGSRNVTVDDVEGLTVNGDLTVDTDVLYVDSTNNKVGIGTTNPGELLEVNSDGSDADGAVLLLKHANNNTTDVISTIKFANNAGSVANIQAGTLGSNSTGYITFNTDITNTSAERMRIHSNGYVGIGTASPTATLTVGALSSGQTGNVVINNEGGNIATLEVLSRTNRSVLKIADNDTIGYMSAENGLLSIGRNSGLNAANINIDSSNRVGIGTTSPAVGLDVGSKTDAIRVPNGTTGQRPTAALGQLRYNTTTSEFEGYAAGAWGKIGGGGDSFGTIAVAGQTNIVAEQENDTLTIVGAGGITATTTAGTDTLTLTGQTSVNPFTTDFFTTANNSTTAFTLSVTPPSEDNLIVFMEGVYQNKNSYTLSGTTLTLDAAPASGTEVVVHIIQNGVVGAGHVVDEFTGNGSTAAYTLSVTPLNENNTFVYLDGVYQEKSTYSVSGNTLTFGANVTSGHSIEIVTPQVAQVNQPAVASIDNVNMFSGLQASEITSTTVASTSATTIATHAVATYRSVKYNVQITQGSNYHTTEINVLHNGTTAYITEYGTIFSGSSLATFDATISSGNLLLQITMGSANSATIKVVSTAIPV
jgi:hypothetical protein